MSTPSKPSASSQTMSGSTPQSLDLVDRDVVQFLMTHPEFFQRHGEVLHRLQVPHPTGLNTISLVERQVEVLRDRNEKLEKKLREFVNVAHANDALMAKIMDLAIALINAQSRHEVLEAIEERLREHFGADRGVVVLFDDVTDCRALAKHSFAKCLSSDDPSLKVFSKLVRGTAPRCGRISDSLWAYLFSPQQPVEAGSAALVPLGIDGKLGWLVIGSHDGKRFHPGMSTDFLLRIGELISAALIRRVQPPASVTSMTVTELKPVTD
ncbi:MAG: DUF484 family protein [Gammaproteobacteria bacterium]|nr:DUF484 family protein [Gammaproteobacteria bacterium]